LLLPKISTYADQGEIAYNKARKTANLKLYILKPILYRKKILTKPNPKANQLKKTCLGKYSEKKRGS
jgi:hypothetical protein